MKLLLVFLKLLGGTLLKRWVTSKLFSPAGGPRWYSSMSKAQVYAWIAMVVLLLVMAAGAFFLHWQLGNARERIGTLDTQLQVAVDTNAGQVAQIDDLTARITVMVAEREADQARAAAAAAEHEQDILNLQAALARARNEREVIYEQDPDAADWGATAVPAAIADRLRQ